MIIITTKGSFKKLNIFVLFNEISPILLIMKYLNKVPNKTIETKLYKKIGKNNLKKLCLNIVNV
jgi:hypothetical protein